MNQELKQYIETDIIPQYKMFDKAHNLAHVHTVITESLLLAKDYPINIDMVYTIAAYHDLGLSKDRATHHLISGSILEKDENLRKWFSTEEIKIMKEAVEDHRASSDHEPRSIYGKIVAEADRIIDPEITLRRTVQYGLKQNPSGSKEWHYNRFLSHLLDKYAKGGYLKLWFEHSKNGEKLKELRLLIDNREELEKVFNRIFKEEKN
ncbi:HD domain-containing protein [Bacteroides sp.]